MIKRIKNTVLWANVISDIKGEKVSWNVLQKGIAKNKSKKKLELRK